MQPNSSAMNRNIHSKIRLLRDLLFSIVYFTFHNLYNSIEYYLHFKNQVETSEWSTKNLLTMLPVSPGKPGGPTGPLSPYREQRNWFCLENICLRDVFISTQRYCYKHMEVSPLCHYILECQVDQEGHLVQECPAWKGSTEISNTALIQARCHLMSTSDVLLKMYILHTYREAWVSWKSWWSWWALQLTKNILNLETWNHKTMKHQWQTATPVSLPMVTLKRWEKLF